MEIKLKKSPRGEWETVNVNAGSTVEDIYRTYGKDLPYKIICANVNNDYQDLNYIPRDGEKVQLLDIRTQAANLVYQYSLSLLFLKAVYNVLGNETHVEIQNSLNKGLYTEISGGEKVTDRSIAEVEAEMRRMVEADLKITLEKVSRVEALDILDKDGHEEKKRILLEELNLKTVRFYTLDGFREFFYGLMVPSTSYIDKFSVMKYRSGVLLRFPHPSNPNVVPELHEDDKLYKAFGEQKRWDKLLGVTYVSDLNDKIGNGGYKDLIQLSEALHEKKIAQIADMIKTQKKRIILIAGPSSSGKTTFARRLCVQLRVNGLEPIYMGTDDYFVEREDTPLDENGERDFENLRALDIELFNANMNGLLKGEEVDLPTFDFMTGHKSFGERLTRIKSNQPIVIEGIHALNENLTPYIDSNAKFKIYISPLTQLNIDPYNRVPTTDERMLRRMVRDSIFRGHDARSTLSAWPKVRAGEDVNIFPYSDEADVLFNSYHVYEISVLKKFAEPLLQAVEPKDDEYAEARRMLRFLRFFRTIEDDSTIVNNSILREFIGGSIFV
ncbi:uridine kinase [Peptostreptococcaceae bacterium pGA-8]|nr:uridine kinase [Peptostreptococcaceae bacterium pGA-8]